MSRTDRTGGRSMRATGGARHVVVAMLALVAARPACAQGSAPVEFRYDAPWAGGGRSEGRVDPRDAAARAEFPSDAPCRWLPARNTGAGPNAQQRGAASAAEARALREAIGRLEGLFSGTPRFATPHGLCMQFSNNGWRGGIEGGHALRGGFLIGTWPGEWLHRRNGRLVFDGETRHIVGSVNTMPTDNVNSVDDAQGAMTAADSPMLRQVGTHQGFPVYAGGLLVIARPGRRLFRPASVERMARWVLAELTYREFETRTDDLGRRYGAQAGEMRREITALLSRLGPSARMTPGCLAGTELEPGSRIRLVVTADDARCTTRMVEPDPDYFDRTLPRSAIQLVTLRALPPEPPAGGLVGAPDGRAAISWMLRALFWGMDWQAFRDGALVGR